jgi:hypothetical protein
VARASRRMARWASGSTGQQVGTVPLAADGMASKVVGPFASVGTRTVGVPYYGDIVTTARTGTTTM